VRHSNEDSLIARDDIGLWAVADGAGGHGSGEIASAAVVAALADLPGGLAAAEILAQVRLRIGAVHVELQQRAAQEKADGIIASTALVLLARGDHLACLWAGDSRAYLCRAGQLSQLTRDHSVVQELVDAGIVAPEDAAGHPQSNAITRAVGATGPLELDKVTIRCAAGDVVLLCSDGLFNAVPEREIGVHLHRGVQADALIAAAIENGARDNVTAIIVAVR
jgi:protein phosphatase/serine/threonine-protein phosphatase Stp1